MNVPLVVNTAMMMNADMATDGPPIQSHQLTPSAVLSVRSGRPCSIAEVEDAGRIVEPVRAGDADVAQQLVDGAASSRTGTARAP